MRDRPEGRGFGRGFAGAQTGRRSDSNVSAVVGSLSPAIQSRRTRIRSDRPDSTNSSVGGVCGHVLPTERPCRPHGAWETEPAGRLRAAGPKASYRTAYASAHGPNGDPRPGDRSQSDLIFQSRHRRASKYIGPMLRRVETALTRVRAPLSRKGPGTSSWRHHFYHWGFDGVGLALTPPRSDARPFYGEDRHDCDSSAGPLLRPLG